MEDINTEKMKRQFEQVILTMQMAEKSKIRSYRIQLLNRASDALLQLKSLSNQESDEFFREHHKIHGDMVRDSEGKGSQRFCALPFCTLHFPAQLRNR